MPCWVLLYGLPGIGKLTIAKELKLLLTNSYIYPGHLFTASVLPFHDRFDDRHNAFRLGVRHYVLNNMGRHRDLMDKTWIFTEVLEEGLYGVSIPLHYQYFSEKSGVTLIPIFLQCQKEEMTTRAKDPGRIERVGAMFDDEDALMKTLEGERKQRSGAQHHYISDLPYLQQVETQWLRPRRVVEDEVGERVEYENEMFLDITHLTASQAALQILSHVVEKTEDEQKKPVKPEVGH